MSSVLLLLAVFMFRETLPHRPSESRVRVRVRLGFNVLRLAFSVSALRLGFSVSVKFKG